MGSVGLGLSPADRGVLVGRASRRGFQSPPAGSVLTDGGPSLTWTIGLRGRGGGGVAVRGAERLERAIWLALVAETALPSSKAAKTSSSASMICSSVSFSSLAFWLSRRCFRSSWAAFWAALWASLSLLGLHLSLLGLHLPSQEALFFL